MNIAFVQAKELLRVAKDLWAVIHDEYSIVRFLGKGWSRTQYREAYTGELLISLVFRKRAETGVQDAMWKYLNVSAAEHSLAPSREGIWKALGCLAQYFFYFNKAMCLD